MEQIAFPTVFTSFLVVFGVYSIYRIHVANKQLSENTLTRILFWLGILTMLMVMSSIGQVTLTLIPLQPEQAVLARNFFVALNVLFILYIAFLAEEIGRLGETFGFKEELVGKRPKRKGKVQR